MAVSFLQELLELGADAKRLIVQVGGAIGGMARLFEGLFNSVLKQPQSQLR